MAKEEGIIITLSDVCPLLEVNLLPGGKIGFNPQQSELKCPDGCTYGHGEITIKTDKVSEKPKILVSCTGCERLVKGFQNRAVEEYEE